MIRAAVGVFLLSVFFATQVTGQSNPREKMKRYIKVPAGYLMVLRQGDAIFAELEKFTTTEKIKSANFTGMGFVNITFGFFDFKTKKYNPGFFKAMELTSMNGTIAWKNDSVSIHAHGTVADKDFRSFGGHILDATVDTGSAEILITVHDQRFERKRDELIGADVLSLDGDR